MLNIKLKNNWNNKTECNAFACIMERNKKWVVGNTYSVYVPLYPDLKPNEYESKGIIRLEEMRSISIDQISDFMAYIVFGFNAQRARRIIKKYTATTAEPDLVLMLFVRVAR